MWSANKKKLNILYTDIMVDILSFSVKIKKKGTFEGKFETYTSGLNKLKLEFLSAYISIFEI